MDPESLEAQNESAEQLREMIGLVINVALIIGLIGVLIFIIRVILKGKQKH